MPENFDPYRKWLGIPPKDQPPHHYRLLGIELFENDPDVIDHAADRQMTHVRAFQSGKHSAVSQKLLTELSAARLCLLTAEKKGAYDAQLRTRLPPLSRLPFPLRFCGPSNVSRLERSGAVWLDGPAAISANWAGKRRASKSSTLLGLASPVWRAAILLLAGFIYRNLQRSSPRCRKVRRRSPADARGNHDTPAKQTTATVLPLNSRRNFLHRAATKPTPATEAWISREATYTVSSTGEGVLALPSLLTDDDPEVEYAVHTRGQAEGIS
jgi:hypothetical protein